MDPFGGDPFGGGAVAANPLFAGSTPASSPPRAAQLGQSGLNPLYKETHQQGWRESEIHEDPPEQPRIASQSIVITSRREEALAKQNAMLDGFLYKKRHNKNSFKKRYVKLSGHSVFYAHSKEGKFTRWAELDLTQNTIVRSVPETVFKQPHVFQLVACTRSYFFKTPDASSLSTWIDAISTQVATAPEEVFIEGELLVKEYSANESLRSMKLRRNDLKTKFVHLSQHKLYLVKDAAELASAKRFVSITNATVIRPLPAHVVGDQFCFEVRIGRRTYAMKAESTEEMMSWVDCLEDAVKTTSVNVTGAAPSAHATRGVFSWNDEELSGVSSAGVSETDEDVWEEDPLLSTAEEGVWCEDDDLDAEVDQDSLDGYAEFSRNYIPSWSSSRSGSLRSSIFLDSLYQPGTYRRSHPAKKTAMGKCDLLSQTGVDQQFLSVPEKAPRRSHSVSHAPSSTPRAPSEDRPKSWHSATPSENSSSVAFSLGSMWDDLLHYLKEVQSQSYLQALHKSDQEDRASDASCASFSDNIPVLMRSAGVASLSVSLCTVDGETRHFGEDTVFTLHECSAPFVFAVLANSGEATVPLDRISLDDMRGRLCLADAINEMPPSSMGGSSASGLRCQFILDQLNSLAGCSHGAADALRYSLPMFVSLKNSGATDAAIAYAMCVDNSLPSLKKSRSRRAGSDPSQMKQRVDLLLDTHHQIAAVEGSTHHFSVMAATIAAGGTNPRTETVCVSPDAARVAIGKAHLPSSAFPPFSLGGCTGASGVSVVILPGRCGVCVYGGLSPGGTPSITAEHVIGFFESYVFDGSFSDSGSL